MNNEDIKKIKDKYNKLAKVVRDLSQLKHDIEEYEKDEVVIGYLRAIKKYEEALNKQPDNILNKEESYFVRSAIESVGYTEDSDIYVYMGTYKSNHMVDIVHGDRTHLIERLRSDADFVLYRNIEANHDIKLTVEEAIEFESEHKIIIPNNIFDYNSYFYTIQNKYFTDIITESKEYGEERILKLVNKNN